MTEEQNRMPLENLPLVDSTNGKESIEWIKVPDGFDYLRDVYPTHMHLWPKPLMAMSIRSKIYMLNDDEIYWLRKIWGGDQPKELYEKSKEYLRSLTRWVNATLPSFGGRAFFRLTGRSPKDAAFNLAHACQVGSGNELVGSIISSERAYEELNAKTYNYPETQVGVVLREWVDIEPTSEFRAFVKGGRLVALSSYFPDVDYTVLRQSPRLIWNAVREIVAKARKFMHMSNYVIDLDLDFTAPNPNLCEYQVIEINPFVPVTNPLLFTWEELLDPPSRGPNIRLGNGGPRGGAEREDVQKYLEDSDAHEMALTLRETIISAAEKMGATVNRPWPDVFEIQLPGTGASRGDLIHRIEMLYPTDSGYEDTSRAGEGLLTDAIRSFGWRNLPLPLLQRYAELCEEKENASIRKD